MRLKDKNPNGYAFYESKEGVLLGKQCAALLALFFDSPGNLGIALQLRLHHIKALCQPALAC